jgi:hypothetical protein
MLDVKRWGLEVGRGEDHVPAVTAAGFLLGGLEWSRAEALSPP